MLHAVIQSITLNVSGFESRIILHSLAKYPTTNMELVSKTAHKPLMYYIGITLALTKRENTAANGWRRRYG